MKLLPIQTMPPQQEEDCIISYSKSKQQERKGDADIFKTKWPSGGKPLDGDLEEE